MKLLKNRKVAVIITAIVVVLMSVWGISKAPARIPAVQTGQWVYDGANVFSAEVEQHLTQGNRELLEEHGAVIAVASVPNVKGWELLDFSIDLADTWGLSGSDFILVMDIEGDNYWLVQGFDLMEVFPDELAGQYVRQFLENDFADKNYGEGAVKLFDALRAWYGNSLQMGMPSGVDDLDFYEGNVESTGGSGFGSTFLLLVLVILLLVVMDGARYTNYRRRYRGVSPTVIYRPLIFGRPRRPAPPPPPPGGNRRPPAGGGFGGFSSGSRPGGASRPSAGGAARRPSSGSFGGSRTGSFGAGRSSGGSFGGGRSGSFGGGRSSGGSRGGSFGGGRSDGRR